MTHCSTAREPRNFGGRWQLVDLLATLGERHVRLVGGREVLQALDRSRDLINFIACHDLDGDALLGLLAVQSVRSEAVIDRREALGGMLRLGGCLLGRLGAHGGREDDG